MKTNHQEGTGMIDQQAQKNQNTQYPEDLPYGRLIGIRLFGIFYAFVGVLIACFRYMLSSFVFSDFITLLIISEGIVTIVCGIGVIFLKEIYRKFLLAVSYLSAFVLLYIILFEEGIILYFANGACLRLIPYPVSILAFCFFVAAIFYFSSIKIRELFH